MKRLAAALTIATLLLLLSAGAASAATANDAASLQEAVRTAGPGETITLEPGNYSVNLVLDTPLTLRGEGATLTAADPSLPVLTVEAPDVTVLGSTVRGSDEAGILVRGAAGASVAEVRATGNGDGVALENTTESMVRESALSGNERDGVRLRDSDRNRVIDVTATGNGWSGISLWTSNGNELRGNEVSRNSHGIFVSSSDDNAIVQNRAVNNDWNGILVWDSTGTSLEGNTATRNRYGIVVNEGQGQSLTGNVTFEATPLVLAIIAGFLAAIVTFVTGWQIFWVSEPKEAARMARAHRILGFTCFAAYIVAMGAIIDGGTTLASAAFLVFALSLYLAKIWSVNAGKGNLGPLLGSLLLIKWAVMLLTYVIWV